MDLSTAKRILIIRLSSLGDILLTTPLLRVIKSSYQEIAIDFVVRAEYSDAIKYNPNLSNIYSYESKSNNEELIKSLNQNNYDLVVDLQNNFRSRKIVSSILKPTLKFKKPSVKKFLLVNFKINLFNEILSIPEMYSEKLKGIELDETGLEFFYPDGIVPRIDGTEKWIGFCPGSKHFTKMWPVEYFIKLGNLLKTHNYKVALLGGEDDREICGEISQKIDNSINLCKGNDLYQTATDMKICELVICNDSGLMHLATAIDVPVIALFGSTVKEFGFFPYKARNLVLEKINGH